MNALERADMEINFQDTPEKFQPLAEEIVPSLLELLRARNARWCFA